MSLLVIDNYDSFTFNLVHLLEKLGIVNLEVKRNDKIVIKDVAKYNKILLSPGPGLPKDAGILLDIIRNYGQTKSILGVCLGHQAIAEVYGGSLINMTRVQHGVKTKIKALDKEVLFSGIPTSFEVGRYHSWIVDRNNFPDCFKITAVDENNNIMALRHKTYDLQGVQFHPESIMTPLGERMLSNWINK